MNKFILIFIFFIFNLQAEELLEKKMINTYNSYLNTFQELNKCLKIDDITTYKFCISKQLYNNKLLIKEFNIFKSYQMAFKIYQTQESLNNINNENLLFYIHSDNIKNNYQTLKKYQNCFINNLDNPLNCLSEESISVIQSEETMLEDLENNNFIYEKHYLLLMNIIFNHF